MANDLNLQGNPLPVPPNDSPLPKGRADDLDGKGIPVDLAAQGGSGANESAPDAPDDSDRENKQAQSGDEMMASSHKPPASGTIHINRVASLILFSVLAFIFAFVIYTMFTRGSGRMGGGYEETPGVNDATTMAESMTVGITALPEMAVPTVSVVPTPPPPPPVIPVVEKKEPEKAQQPPQARRPQLQMAAAAKPPPPDPWTAEMMRLEAVRQKQFEAAIAGELFYRLDMSGTRAQNQRNANPWTPPASSRSKSQMISDLNAEIARTDALIAEYSDPDAAYRKRLADLQGASAGGGGSFSGIPPEAASVPSTPSGGGMGGGMFGGGAVPVAAGGAVAASGASSAMSAGRGNGLSDFDGGADRWLHAAQMDIPSPFVLRAGTVIPAVLLSGINSDLPGQIMAQVSQNVYDTATGRYLIIPQGTRLVGGYSNEVEYGQSRIFVAWQRLTFPDGRAFDIGSQPGTTGAGYAGLRDKVNNHYFRIFGSALMMSAIIGGISFNQDKLSGSSSSTGNGEGDNRQRMSDAMSEALGQNLGQVMTEMIRKNLDISPTLEIRPGFRMNVMLVKDLRFKDRYRAFGYQYAKE